MARRANYRMTPRRRAALRQAQLASARKRRRAGLVRGAKTVGTVLGGVAATAAVYHLNRAATNPRSVYKDYQDVKGFIKRHKGNGDPNAPKVTSRVAVHPNSRKAARGYYPGHVRSHASRAVAGRRIRSK